jgi:hypothetical protein
VTATLGAADTILGPYREAAKRYIDLGWPSVLPLPHGAKKITLSGWTGHHGAWPTAEDVIRWLEDADSGNVALRMPRGVIGIDVDDYDGKHGADQFAMRQAQWGELPPTWVSTSRVGTASGIRYYRVPEGLKWPGSVAKDIEVIQTVHRYAVVAPSIHPRGEPYVWIEARGGYVTTDMPSPDEFPWLPDGWVKNLTGGEVYDGTTEPRKWDATWGDTTALLASGDPCQAMDKAISAYTTGKQFKARHDALLPAIMRVVRLSDQGHAGGQNRTPCYPSSERHTPAPRNGSSTAPPSIPTSPRNARHTTPRIR